MADVANKYELQAEYVTMIAGSSIVYDATKQFGCANVGKAVMQSGDGTVDLVTADKEVFGKLISVDPDGFCTIQDEGYCSLPCDTSILYTEANSAVVGGATAGTVKIPTSVAATAAIRNARAIQADGTGFTIVKLS